jgi:hypothetical protein
MGEVLLVVVNDLDVIRVPVLPAKADAPLIVDANAVLARAIAFEFFESVAGRDTQVLELLGGINEANLTEHEPEEVGREPPDALPLKQALGVPIRDLLDHQE